MVGGGAGWGLSAPGVHNLSIVVGGITARAAPAEHDASPRELLCLTVSANHEVVDGAPLARFSSDLARRLERAEALEDLVGSARATEGAQASEEPQASKEDRESAATRKGH